MILITHVFVLFCLLAQTGAFQKDRQAVCLSVTQFSGLSPSLQKVLPPGDPVLC